MTHRCFSVVKMHFYLSRCFEKHMTESADDTENILDYLFNFLKGFSTMCEYWVGKVDSSLSILLHEEAYRSYTFTKIFQKQSVFRLWNNFGSFLFFGIFLAKNFFLSIVGFYMQAVCVLRAWISLLHWMRTKYKFKAECPISLPQHHCFPLCPGELLPSLYHRCPQWFWTWPSGKNVNQR